jgi:hypothetical protein
MFSVVTRGTKYTTTKVTAERSATLKEVTVIGPEDTLVEKKRSIRKQLHTSKIIAIRHTMPLILSAFKENLKPPSKKNIIA